MKQILNVFWCPVIIDWKFELNLTIFQKFMRFYKFYIFLVVIRNKK